MAKRTAAMQSHHTLNMPAPRLRRALGMPPNAVNQVPYCGSSKAREF